MMFGNVMPLSIPDISYAVATKSKLNKVVQEQTRLVGAACSDDCCEREWDGITFPGHNGIAIILRQIFITDKTRLRYILWHEMGHAYAFAYESTEKFWDMEFTKEDRFVYHFWQEVVANFISLRVAMKTGTSVGIATGISLKQGLEGKTAELAYYCSEAYFTGIVADAIWTLEKRIKDDQRRPGVRIELRKGDLMFDLVRLIRLIREEVITIDDLSEFSEDMLDGVKLFMQRFSNDNW